jgi:selenocysteine lyase/cysteine desulfurase
MIDVEHVRRETRGCEHVTHLNNAGASLPPQPVLDAVIGHLELEARVGGHVAAQATRPVESVRIAALC